MIKNQTYKLILTTIIGSITFTNTALAGENVYVKYNNQTDSCYIIVHDISGRDSFNYNPCSLKISGAAEEIVNDNGNMNESEYSIPPNTSANFNNFCPGTEVDQADSWIKTWATTICPPDTNSNLLTHQAGTYYFHIENPFNGSDTHHTYNYDTNGVVKYVEQFNGNENTYTLTVSNS